MLAAPVAPMVIIFDNEDMDTVTLPVLFETPDNLSKYRSTAPPVRLISEIVAGEYKDMYSLSGSEEE